MLRRRRFLFYLMLLLVVLVLVFSGCSSGGNGGGNNGGDSGNGGNDNNGGNNGGDNGGDSGGNNGGEDINTATITGKVTVSGADNPIPGVTITTNPVTSTVYTDEQGVYSLKVSPSPEGTTYRIFAAKEGYLDSSAIQTVYKDQTVTVNLQLKPAPNSGIGGQILNNGVPCSGITVSVEPGGSSSVTDSSGNYSIPLEPGTYMATVNKNGLATLEFRFKVSAEQVVTNDLKMVSDMFLEAHYPLDGNADDTNGDKNGSLISGAPTTDRFSREKKAISFDGSGMVTLPASFDTPGNIMTVTAWIKLDPTLERDNVIYYSGDNGKFFFFVNKDGKLGLTYELEETAANTKLSNGTVPTGKWVHVAVSRYKDDLVFYINAAHSGAWSGVTEKNFRDGGLEDQCAIGAKGDGALKFQGSIDEVRIYQTCLSSIHYESLALWDIN